MNKRIEELADQAAENTAGLYNIPDEFCRMFTELIVQEYDFIIEKYSKANRESDDWVAMICMMQKELKKHFGVEK